MKSILIFLLTGSVFGCGVVPQLVTRPTMIHRPGYRQVAHLTQPLTVRRIDGTRAYVNNGDLVQFRQLIPDGLGHGLFYVVGQISGKTLVVEADGAATRLLLTNAQGPNIDPGSRQ